MSDKRNGPRHRVQKTATIKFNRNTGFHSTGNVDCRVRSLSPMGARLEVASKIGIPDKFVLWMEFDELAKQCQVVWRADSKLGVKFMPMQPAPITTTSSSPPTVQAKSAKPRWMVWR